MSGQAEIRFKPLHSSFAAEVEGIDFTKPVPEDVIAQVEKGIDKYGVLVFRKTCLDNDRHVAFSKQFGELDSMPLIRGKGRFPEQPHIFDVSNMNEQGEIVKETDRVKALMSKGNELWHSDMQYHPRRDKYSFLRAEAIPPPGSGGETEFVDSRTAYESLSPEWKKRLEGMVSNCSLLHNRRGAAPELYQGVDPLDWSITRWKATYPHEGSGRTNLYVTSYVYQFDGMSVEESQTVVQELLDHGSQPQFVYRVLWEQPGDMVMWDNTATWHRALDDSGYKFTHKRDMRRTNTFDDGPHAWGENEKGNSWTVKLPKDPLAHEKIDGQTATPVPPAVIPEVIAKA